MKYLLSFFLLIFSFGAIAQVQKAKEDLPENKINPNQHLKQPVPFDRRMYEKKSNKRHDQKTKSRRKRKALEDSLENK